MNTPITGNSYVIVNQTTQLSNATAGGTWSSLNTGIATISSTGLVTGVSTGNAVIKYLLGIEYSVFAIGVQPLNTTNGFNLQLVLDASRNRVTWGSQGSSDSGRYYQDFHALCNEELIKQLFPTINPSTPEFSAILSSLTRSVILEAINYIFDCKQLIDSSKLIFNRSDERLYLQTVQPFEGFCGIAFSVAEGDFAVQFKNLILFFDKAMTFNLYLYNDMLIAPISVIPVTVNAGEQTTIPVTGQMALLLNYLTPLSIKGGRYYLGYYQRDIDDLGGKAMFYNMCYSRFNAFRCIAFSAPVLEINNQRNFNRNIVGANNLMYGMNAEVNSYVDPTNKLIEGIGLCDNLFGLIMAKKIIENLVFSYRNNKIQVNLQGNEMLEKLYLELNSSETTNPEQLNYGNGLRRQIISEKKRVKEGFQKRTKLIAACG
jgi:hypothetical protein